MANLVPSLVLFLWIPITVALFVRLGPATAAAVALLGAALLLPVGYGPDPPGLPTLERGRVAALLALFLTILLNARALRNLRHHRGMVLLALMVVVTPFFAAMTNREPYAHLRGLTLHDGFMVAETRASCSSHP